MNTNSVYRDTEIQIKWITQMQCYQMLSMLTSIQTHQ